MRWGPAEQEALYQTSLLEIPRVLERNEPFAGEIDELHRWLDSLDGTANIVAAAREFEGWEGLLGGAGGTDGDDPKAEPAWISLLMPWGKSVWALWLWLAGVALTLRAPSLTAQQGSRPALAGTVTAVTDGDTLRIQLASGPIRVRLGSIDAPETTQPHGKAAKAALQRLVGRGGVELEFVTQDRYERLVAVVHANGRSVNEQMVRSGAAGETGTPGAPGLGVSPGLATLEARAARRGAGLLRGDARRMPRGHREGLISAREA